MTKWANSQAVKFGVVAGITTNGFLWLFTPVSWLWWNFFGFMVATLAAVLVTTAKHNNIRFRALFALHVDRETTRVNWPLIYKIVVLYFFLIILFCYLCENILSY
jgi:hypothetical protein